MNKMIQIRNVPPELHRRLKAQAALAGMTLSEFLLRQIEEFAQLPTPDQLRTRLMARERVNPGESAAAAVRAERDTH